MGRIETRWLTAWILLLSFISGYINLASIALFSIPTTHMTGNLSNMVLEWHSQVFSEYYFYIILILSFFAGGIFSGIIFSKKLFHPSQRYGHLMISFGVLLLIVNHFLHDNRQLLWFLSFMVGTQNGMFIYFRGTMIRTSHFTGYLTDAGFALGRIIRGKYEDLWKLTFYLANIGMFCLGGISSLYAYVHLKTSIIHVAAILYMAVGTYYFIFRKVFFKDIT